MGLCHLVGRTQSELIDENIGRLGVFAPSQSPFADQRRQDTGEVFAEGFHRKSVTLEMDALAKNRALAGETDPAKIRPLEIQIEVG